MSSTYLRREPWKSADVLFLTDWDAISAVPIAKYTKGGSGDVIKQPQKVEEQDKSDTIHDSNHMVKDGDISKMTPPISTAPAKRSAKDFLFGKMLGEGSFSTVYLAKDVKTHKEFAIKVCDKTHIVRENKIPYVKREKEALNILANSCPYFVKLYCTFQDVRQLYFVLTYAPYGELLHLIKKMGSLDVNLTRFYTCELVLALEALKERGIIHRDLKPENILLDENMNILITDFGSAKIIEQDSKTEEVDPAQNNRRRNSFVGTANYVSPELLTDKPTTNASDLWALGCIIYQMLTGKHCFTGGSDYLIFRNVLNLDYVFPDSFPKVARDIVNDLLKIDAEERLGARDLIPYTSIRDHQFFESVDWNNLGSPPSVTTFLVDSEQDDDCFNHAEPGLDGQQMARLIGLRVDGPTSTIYLDDAYCAAPEEAANLNQVNGRQNHQRKNMADISPNELDTRLTVQRRSNKYHELVDGNLILKQGLIDKRKGLIPRRRMFLLTLGPRLYYVEPTTMTLKGEVPWTEELKVDVKNFKSFYIHTPNRTYNLEDPDGYALNWKQAIEDVHQFYFSNP